MNEGRGDEPRFLPRGSIQLGSVCLAGEVVGIWLINGQRSILVEDEERVLQALREGYKPQDAAEWLTIGMFVGALPLPSPNLGE